MHVIDRPNQPYLGTGEGGQGPTAAAIANALANATGQRFRESLQQAGGGTWVFDLHVFGQRSELSLRAVGVRLLPSLVQFATEEGALRLG